MFTDCDQILDIAQGILYLHTHASGPIIHGDLKGVSYLPSSTPLDGIMFLTDECAGFL